MKEKEEWPDQDTWVYLYANDLIPLWLTFEKFKKEWSKYVSGGDLDEEV